MSRLGRSNGPDHFFFLPFMFKFPNYSSSDSRDYSSTLCNVQNLYIASTRAQLFSAFTQYDLFYLYNIKVLFTRTQTTVCPQENTFVGVTVFLFPLGWRGVGGVGGG